MSNDNKGGDGAPNPDSKDNKAGAGGDGGGGGGGNGAGGGDDKNQTIPKHRFDEVNNEAQSLRKWKEDREREDRERNDKKLKDEKKFEELATQKEQEAEKARQEARQLKTERAIERAAFKAGIKDTEAAIKLIDMSKISVKDDGTIEGVDDAMKQLLTDRAYLKEGGSTTPNDIGGGSNPDNNDGTKQKYPLSWVKQKWADVAWTRSKHEEYGNITGSEFLDKIEKNGQIDRTK